MPTANDMQDSIAGYRRWARNFNSGREESATILSVSQSISDMLNAIGQRKREEKLRKEEEEKRTAEKEADRIYEEQEFGRRRKLLQGEELEAGLESRKQEEISYNVGKSRARDEINALMKQHEPTLMELAQIESAAQDWPDVARFRSRAYSLPPELRDYIGIKERADGLEKMIDKRESKKGKEGDITPETQAVMDEITALIQQHPNLKLPLLALKSSLRAGEGYGEVLKQIEKLNQEIEGGENGDLGIPEAANKPLTATQQSTADQGFGYAGQQQYPLTPSGMRQGPAPIADSTYSVGDNWRKGMPTSEFVTPESKFRQYDWRITKLASDLLKSGKLNHIKDKAERATLAKMQAQLEIEKLFKVKRPSSATGETAADTLGSLFASPTDTTPAGEGEEEGAGSKSMMTLQEIVDDLDSTVWDWRRLLDSQSFRDSIDTVHGLGTAEVLDMNK